MMLISLFVFVLAITTINAQCSDRRAVCINIRNCSSVIAMLQRESPPSAKTLQTVRSLKCGYQGSDPLVCCLNEMTPRTASPITESPRTESPRTESPRTESPRTESPRTESLSLPDVSNHPNLRLLDPRCGPLTTPKLIGGNKTGIFDFPWMALIAYNISGRTNPEFHCGGTIISSRYILTAAHCVTLLPSTHRLIGVRVGDHDINKERDCERDENGQELECAEPYQEFVFDSVHYHPDYSRRLLRNDIALIRLSSSIDFRPLSVKSICLPYGTATHLSQRKAIVTGWGYATEYGPRSPDLLQAKLPIVPNEYCKEVFAQSTEIWHKQLCAGGTNNVDSCSGDSGGPLQAPGIYNGRVVRTVQYGIVSFGLEPPRCGTEGYPGVYTNVAYYMDWILDTMTD